MAVNTQNIIVGHGDLYVWNGSVESAQLPAFDASAATLRDAFEVGAGATNWTPLGATMDGVELSYTPEFGEINVDQMKGVAKMWNQSNEVSVTTTLAESSYFNLLFALGLDGSYASDGDAQQVLSLGVPQDAVVERAVAVVGPGVPAEDGTPRERVYLARRVLSVEGTTINLSRTDATTLAVTLRLLPSSVREHRNSQYGFIVDRMVGVDAEDGPTVPAIPDDEDLPGPY